MSQAPALFLLLPSLLLAAVPPTVERPVTDTQGLLSPDQVETVARELVRLREETGTQMAVLIVGTTEGEPIEDYAMRAAQAWRGGQQGADNGLLYVLAVNDRRMRLEVGYGLEEHLPDGTVRRLLDAQGPLMRERNYTGALVNIIQGVRERLPAQASAANRPQAASASPDASHLKLPNRKGTGVVAGGITAFGLCLMLCIVLHPRLRRWMGERVAFGISGVLSVPALGFLAFCGSRTDMVNPWILGWSFCIYCALMYGARALAWRDDGWKWWGIIAMGGILLSLPNASNETGAGGVLLFNILISCFLATLLVIPVFVVLSVIKGLFAAAWAGASTTYRSGSPTPAPTNWTPRGSSSTSSRRESSSSSSSGRSLWRAAVSSSSSRSSSSSSSRSSSSSSSSGSSSSSSSWKGGGGSFGGGGASSSW